jgi:hypothetical protein
VQPALSFSEINRMKMQDEQQFKLEVMDPALTGDIP